MSRTAISADSVFGFPGADTVIVDDGRVEAISRRADVDLSGPHHPAATILPTFTDSHIHPLGYAALLTGTSLHRSRDLGDLQARLAEASSRLPAGTGLVAQRLDDSRLGGLPDRTHLDAAVGERPTIVYRYCGHVAVASTAALDLAGIDLDTTDPPGGTIDRDRRGVPTGVLRETAVDLLAPHLEPILMGPSRGEVLEAMEGLVATGITHIGAMVAGDLPLWCGVGDELSTLCDLASDLPLSADVMVIAGSPDSLEAAAGRLEAAGGALRFWGWKGFADGSLGGHTAAMWDPYQDEATTGTLRLTEVDAATARRALDLGGVVAVHAIGDRAIDATLDMFEKLVADGADPSRLRIEHVSVPTPKAVQRMAHLGVIASVQPSFLVSEPDWVPARLGRGRSVYPLASLRQAGVGMIGGSDSPVERPDPLQGIAAAVNRTGWNDAEHLDLTAAVDLYTGAAAEHFGKLPPLSPGSPADLVVVEGEVGKLEASVTAVYQAGVAHQIMPTDWPG